MRRLAGILGLALAASSAGCYSQQPILELNRSNRLYLERLELQLSLSSEQVAEFQALADEAKPAFLAEQRQDNVAELRELFADTSAVRARLLLDVQAAYARHGVANGTVANARPAELNQELAALQARAYEELDDVKRRGVIVDAYEDLIRALQALRASGEQIDGYLETGTLARLFTEAKALDREKLKKIGDDLQAVAERLKPLVLPK